jgi:predicted enzyme related to lactoylglutathione lyase
MIGRLYEVVVDCPEPATLARFYADLDEAEQRVLALGGRRLEESGDGGASRVYADPAGHPFCVCLDDPSAP